MEPITAVIITLNEERDLPRALDSLKGVVDEIIVVDSGSTDQTESISRHYGARFIHHTWAGYGAQKNFGIEQAKHNWILSLDADEALDDNLQAVIKGIRTPEADIYWINRMPNYCGHWVHHSGWYPQYIPRLFDRTKARWNLSKVHESLVIQDGARRDKLKGLMLHYTYSTIEEQRSKAHHYALLGAKELYENKVRVGPNKAWLSASFKFFQSYIIRLGFLDGWAGWQIARFAAITNYRKYQRLYTLCQHGYAKRILISRTDGIGDMVLTLPIAGWYKAQYPDALIWVLGREFNKAVALSDPNITGYISIDRWEQMTTDAIRDELLKLQLDAVVHMVPNALVARCMLGTSISQSIGDSHRFKHFLYLNNLVDITRKGSGLHESVLNTILMEPLGINRVKSIEKLRFHHHLKPYGELQASQLAFIGHGDRPCIILHPKSHDNTREWGLNNFRSLACSLVERGYRVLITGSESDGAVLAESAFFEDLPDQVINTCGALNVREWMLLIARCSALVASSTGPLHLASGIGIVSIGLFPSKADLDPVRWRPLSEKSAVISHPEACRKCKPKRGDQCACMKAITVEEVLKLIIKKTPLT